MSEATTETVAAPTSEGTATASEGLLFGSEEQTATTATVETTEATTTEETTTEPARKAPETYEFKAPEGKEFDKGFLDAFTEQAKELDLTQEQAQKLLDTMDAKVAEVNTARVESVRSEWLEASRIDKEFGGDKLNENLSFAKTALEKFGSPEFKTLLKDSGLGNHPEILRTLYRVGKAMADDNIVTGNKPGTTKESPRDFNSIANALYPNSGG